MTEVVVQATVVIQVVLVDVVLKASCAHYCNILDLAEFEVTTFTDDPVMPRIKLDFFGAFLTASKWLRLR